MPLASCNFVSSTIKRIDYIDHRKLKAEFQATKDKFLRSGYPSDEDLMFHGTDRTSIDSILQSNLDPDYKPAHKAKGAAYGDGVYFSKNPSVALSYGTLILCRVLTGRVQVKVESISSLRVLTRAINIRSIYYD